MKLTFLSGPLSGQKFKVEANVTIGRGASNSLVIPDASVSVVHCEIQVTDGCKYIIRDLGSTNGTKLNGKRIVSEPLHDGDSIGIGKTRAEVQISDVIATRAILPAETEITSKTLVDNKRYDFTESLTPAPSTPNAEDTLSGNIFGQVTYFLKRRIARGGMGAIYEAEQFGAEGFIKKVAIKTILPTYARNENFVASFVGEAKLVANLVHQNIVQIHHLGRHDDGYYIAMEYIEGINLTDFMAMHRRIGREVPHDIATFIVSRLCRGLEYAHSKKDDRGFSLGLVHRDVSSNNVMITHEGEVKLTDFGVARAARFMEDDGEYLVGSVEYMSPEQAACQNVDSRSDLFSLGLLYYELLTSVRVFECHNEDIDETISRVQACKIPDPRTFRPDIPETIVATLMRCLEHNRDNRPQTAGILAYDLEREMYSKGYGPTIVVLARYVEEIQKAATTGR